MSAADRYHREILRIFSPFLGDRILEVGAGSGNISRLIVEREPTHLYALEPSKAMYALLSRRLGGLDNVSTHSCLLAGLLAGNPALEVDSVLSVNVLEHVEDDVRELGMMRAALRPGGHLCLWVPAFGALYSRFDRSLGHFRRYRRREVAAKLEAAGLQVVRLGYRDVVGMVAWFVVCRLLGMELTPGRVGVYDRLVIPAVALLGRYFDPPLGKNVVAVARRAHVSDRAKGRDRHP